MGNGATVNVQKCIFVEYESTVFKVTYPNACSPDDLLKLIQAKTNSNDAFKIKLLNNKGKFLRIHCDMQQNTIREPYSLVTLSNEVYGMEVLTETERIKIKNEIDEYHQGLKKSKEVMGDISNKDTSNNSTKNSKFDNGIMYPDLHLSVETIEHLRTPTFNIWHWEPNEMLSILEFMFDELGLIEEFKIDNLTLKRWLVCIKANYRNNPFHNFRHCFCVAQMMYGLIHTFELHKIMKRTELGILFISAICHDLDHPGFNNLYQINARTELAIRYNDISPLENHHCAVAFQILSNSLCNILANVSNEVYKEIRIGMVKLILATDMARHKEIVDTFRKNLANFDTKNEEHINSLKMILIKCCDISNEVRPFEISEPWVECLLEEYFMQSDREKLEGLPVANYMDREKVTKSNSQVGFIKFVLLPMFETLMKLFPKIKNTMIVPLRTSLNRYEDMKRFEEEKQTIKE